jgi:membrane protein implicated in regulation of membrane protease activity
MAMHDWWWVLALGLGILELISGTFYLLVLAAGSAAGGIAAMAGAPAWGQLAAAAGVSLAGVAVVRRMRTGAAGTTRSGRNPDMLADVGERVHVEAWGEDGRARVRYRGTDWTAELAPGEAAAPGEHTIREVAGNRLILSRR